MCNRYTEVQARTLYERMRMLRCIMDIATPQHGEAGDTHMTGLHCILNYGEKVREAAVAASREGNFPLPTRGPSLERREFILPEGEWKECARQALRCSLEQKEVQYLRPNFRT